MASNFLLPLSVVPSDTEMSITTPATRVTSYPASPTPSEGSSIGEEDGVGLANPQLSKDRRHILDLVNRLHRTG
jgi:hypothetical protein